VIESPLCYKPHGDIAYAVRPHRLLSLLEVMNRFQPDVFTTLLSTISELAKYKGSRASIDKANRDTWIDAFEKVREHVRDVNLKASLATIDRINILLQQDKVKASEFIELSDELRKRIEDELSHIFCLALSGAEAEIFEHPQKGWEKLVERFPKILSDVEEARKCYALSRYAACVYHSCQIIEVGLVELGTFIDVKDHHSGWTAVSSTLEKIVKSKHADRTRFQRENFSFLEQVEGTVQGLKNAWRNKISHSEGRLTLLSKDFTPEISEEILYATRAFMRRLADDLPPSS
jgi:hypothetical protein